VAAGGLLAATGGAGLAGYLGYRHGDKTAADAKPKRTVAMDLDGTLTTPGQWKSDTHFAPLRKGAKEGMAELRKRGYTIVINTCRGNVVEVKKFLDRHGIVYDHINKNPDQPPGSSHKIFAGVYVDDRAIDATADWADLPDRIDWKFAALEAQEHHESLTKKADDPYPDELTSPLAIGGTAATAGGAAVGLGALAARPLADKLHRGIQRHLPVDAGLAGRMSAYHQGIAQAGKDPSQLMSAYVRGGHDVLSNKGIGNKPGLHAAKSYINSPLGLLMSGSEGQRAAKIHHYEQFAASQIVRELYGDRAHELLTKARFKPEYAKIEADIAKVAPRFGVSPANWHQHPGLKARFQPLYDALDRQRNTLLANAGRNAGISDASSRLFYNDAWRTARTHHPELYQRILAAGVKGPADLTKLPPAMQNEVVKLFATKSQVGQHVAGKFRAAWRQTPTRFGMAAGHVGNVAKGINIANKVLPAIKRFAPHAAVGGGLLASLGLAASHIGRGHAEQQHHVDESAWRQRLIDQVKREVTPPPLPPSPPSILSQWWDRARAAI
jgi:hypothetical protein